MGREPARIPTSESGITSSWLRDVFSRIYPHASVQMIAL